MSKSFPCSVLWAPGRTGQGETDGKTKKHELRGNGGDRKIGGNINYAKKCCAAWGTPQ